MTWSELCTHARLDFFRHVSQVEMERGQELAEEYKIPYVEVSAKAGVGVQEVFNVIGR